MDSVATICRLCLRKDAGTGFCDLFGQNLISMKIMSLFQLTLMQGLNWPQNVCRGCVSKLDEMCKFRKEVIDNQILIEQNFGPVVLKQNLSVNILSTQPVVIYDNCTIQESIIDFEETLENEGDDLEIEICAPLESVMSNDNISGRRTTRSSERKPKNAQPLVNVMDDTSRLSVKKEAATVTGEDLGENDESYDIQDDDRDVGEELGDTEDVSNKSSEKFKDVDEAILNFMKLNCTLCEATDFKTFTKLRLHYTKQHSCKGFVLCCNIKHLRRHKLYEHIQFHLDPTVFKCKTCQKTFNSSHNLNMHIKMTHLPEEERVHKCKECERRFGTAFQLKQHMMTHVVEEEKSFECPECSKMFPGRPHLLSHIRLVHEKRKPYPCELCDRAFSGKVFLTNHMAAVHTGETLKVKCTHCNKFFANELSMKKHLARLNVTGEKCVCPECGHESPNKTALQGHIQRNHNPKRASFICISCGKQFKSLKTLTEHTAVHTGERLYTCLYCPKQFNSNANKYSHQKKKHPTEWGEANRKKTIGKD